MEINPFLTKDENPVFYFKTEEPNDSSIDSSFIRPFNEADLFSPVKNYDSFVDENERLSKVSDSHLLAKENDFVKKIFQEEYK